MDIDRLGQIVYKPEETAKLDFKIEAYKINEPKPNGQDEIQKWKKDKEQQWAELTKDIIALANGNIGTATQEGYLIIGADDKLKSDGTPQLRDVGDPGLDRKKILDKVNSYCQPKIPDIQCELITLDGINLLVISIPPSRYLHKLSKQLKTPKKEYSPHTVLIRRGDGEETYEASPEEQKAIQLEKQEERFTNNVDEQNASDSKRSKKLSLEVYDRKIKIYRITRTFLGLIISEGTIPLENLLQFASDQDEALFLFDREVDDYLKTLYRDAAKLYSVNKQLANPNLPIGEKRSRLAEEESELLAYFTKQIEFVRNLFYKHIYL